mmetsp:Transcript_38358/g.92505  ORF Transcript_38358/g.92505 Transcript_38358/m.92505 type:complete len:470 (-) Transcript_38358:160-1569(-)
MYEQSTMNSKSVPVEGRLADLSDNDSYSNGDDCDDNEGGIVILDESTEDEYEESMRESLENSPARRQTRSSSRIAYNTRCVETEASMYQNEPSEIAATVRADANQVHTVGLYETLDFEQLLQEADDHSDSDRIDDQEEEDPIFDAPSVSRRHVWHRNHFSFRNKRARSTTRSRPSVAPLSSCTPVRATRICHDKFVVEMDIVPSNGIHARLDVRDVIDVMANIELLHLWFDPVPAVFDAMVKDGSGSIMVSPRSSPSNSLADDNANNRQYDGQWVEISTPPLSIPSDSRISGCLRAICLSFRSLIGFPARIRSMIFVERGCNRIGMTLGPYPDGFLCQSGTMAYHTFKVRMSDVESGITDNTQSVVISDEVQLRKGSDDEFDVTRRRSCICSLFRFLLGFLERALFFRWYQPDLASYMQQTISSMDKLRTLVQRGESAAYAGGELIMVGDDWEGKNGNGNLAMGTPLLC